MTLFEAWKGVKHSARHLMAFGSICYAHLLDVKRSKLDNKVEVYVLLGYTTTAKGYKVYNVTSNKVFVSRDLIIDQSSYYYKDEKVIVKDMLDLLQHLQIYT